MAKNLASLSSLFTLFLFACGTGGITFPQGPTSGADNLGINLPKTYLSSTAYFDLKVEKAQDTELLKFHWTPPQEPCLQYNLILVPTPLTPHGKITETTQIEILTSTLEEDFAEEGSITELVQSLPYSVSALVLCSSEENEINPFAPYLRSDFEILTDLFPPA